MESSNTMSAHEKNIKIREIIQESAKKIVSLVFIFNIYRVEVKQKNSRCEV
jgi:hypothetical protein